MARFGRKSARALFFSGLLVAVLFFYGRAEAQDKNEGVQEYAVKAAFILNFARFVDWPEKTFQSDDGPIIFCVLGDNPFEKFFDSVIGDKKAQNRHFKFRQFQNPSDMEGACQIAFFNLPEDKMGEGKAGDPTGAAFSKTLTIGESEDFARRGGMIRFYLEEKKIRFEINLAAAERNGIHISSKLLKVGKIYSEEKQGGRK